MLLDKSKNEFSKSPQPFRIKWSTRIDIYGGRREAWGKGETEAGKKEFGKWGEEGERCTASEPAIYDPATSSRPLPRRRRSQVEDFVKSGTRRSSLCLESRSRFHLKTLEPDPGTEWRSRSRAHTSFHARKAFARKAGIPCLLEIYPSIFILSYRIPWTEEFSGRDSGSHRSSLSSSRETFHEFIYFLFYFPFILLFAFEKEMISRNLLMSLHFLTIWIVKRTRESILDLKVLFSILERRNDIKFVMLYENLYFLYVYTSYDNRKLLKLGNKIVTCARWRIFFLLSQYLSPLLLLEIVARYLI